MCQTEILRILKNRSMSTTEIANELKINRCGVTQSMKGLFLAGMVDYIEKHTGSARRRIYYRK